MGLDRLLHRIFTSPDGVILADPVTATIGIIGLGMGAYGIAAGERAKSDARDQYNQAKSDAERQAAAERAQMVLDKQEMDDMYGRQKVEQAQTTARLKSEQEASLAQVRSQIPGMESRMGEDLLAQQEYAYKRMAPQLESRLNALGLLQSGALPEAQARVQGDLESQRQAALADFRRNAENQLNIQQPLANTSADVERQYANLGRNINTEQQNLSQQFANQNTAYANEIARQQYLAGINSANSAAAQSSANAYMNFAGQVGQGALMYYGSRQRQPEWESPSLAAYYNAGYGAGPNYGLGPSWNAGRPR